MHYFSKTNSLPADAVFFGRESSGGLLDRGRRLIKNPFVVTFPVGADPNQTLSLSLTLEKKRTVALRAGFRHGLLPEQVLAFRILIAAVKDSTSLRLSLDHLPLAALRTGHPGGLPADVAALRIAAAGDKLAEAPLLRNQMFPAPGAILIQLLVGLDLDVIADLDNTPGILALGIPGAGQKLPIAPTLLDHGSAALVTDLFIQRGLIVCLFSGEFSRVLALRVVAAGDETAETPPFHNHGRAALVAIDSSRDLLPFQVLHAL